MTVGDIGAGVGQLGSWLRDMGVTNVSWSGWDGGSNVEGLAGRVVELRDVEQYVVPLVCYMDAARSLAGEARIGPFDWVVSVEVGEHIPAGKDSSTFLDNLVLLAREGVVLTWAVPGQGGAWHVNEQDNRWVVEKMEGRGMTYQQDIATDMRNRVTHLNWLRNTIMVFTNTNKNTS